MQLGATINRTLSASSHQKTQKNEHICAIFNIYYNKSIFVTRTEPNKVLHTTRTYGNRAYKVLRKLPALKAFIKIDKTIIAQANGFSGPLFFHTN